MRKGEREREGTCTLEGLRTSKDAEALNESVANGFEKTAVFTMFRFLVSTAWEILLSFSKGVEPTTISGSSSDKDVYLLGVEHRQLPSQREGNASKLSHSKRHLFHTRKFSNTQTQYMKIMLQDHAISSTNKQMI